MKQQLLIIAVIILFVISGSAYAEKVVSEEKKKDEKGKSLNEHRIRFGLGYNFFFPESKDDAHDGIKPDNSGTLNNAEWTYLIDEGINEFDYHSPTAEIAYEYIRWGFFGVELTLGGYGNKKTSSFEVSGNQVDSEVQIVVIHFTVTPRVHLVADAFDFWIGPLLGTYIVDVKWNLKANYRGEEFTDVGKDYESTYGLGGNLGFDISINELIAIGVEGRSVWAPVYPTSKHPFRLNGGGSMIMVSAILHL